MRTPRIKQAEYLRLWKESGLTQFQFCQEMGIQYSTFKGWRHKEISSLNNPSVTSTPLIVPVSITDKFLPQTNQHCVIVHTKSAIIEIQPGFPADEVTNVIKAVIS